MSVDVGLEGAGSGKIWHFGHPVKCAHFCGCHLDMQSVSGSALLRKRVSFFFYVRIRCISPARKQLQNTAQRVVE